MELSGFMNLGMDKFFDEGWGRNKVVSDVLRWDFQTSFPVILCGYVLFDDKGMLDYGDY